MIKNNWEPLFLSLDSENRSKTDQNIRISGAWFQTNAIFLEERLLQSTFPMFQYWVHFSKVHQDLIHDSGGGYQPLYCQFVLKWNSLYPWGPTNVRLSTFDTLAKTTDNGQFLL